MGNILFKTNIVPTPIESVPVESVPSSIESVPVESVPSSIESVITSVKTVHTPVNNISDSVETISSSSVNAILITAPDIYNNITESVSKSLPINIQNSFVSTIIYTDSDDSISDSVSESDYTDESISDYMRENCYTNSEDNSLELDE